jgi:uncharacterized membrane protein
MPNFFVAYVATAAVFLAADFLWLSYASSAFYRPKLGELLSDSPNLTIAAVFYLVYAIGIVVFAVLPATAARSASMAIGLGALLGLVAYGTYDITNLATIRGWPASVSVVDLAWGVFVTSLAAASGYLTLKMVQGV